MVSQNIMNPEYVSVNQVSRMYQRTNGAVEALSEVSFAIHQGELIGLVGPSGSGKSTLLNILGGLDRPSSGQVAVGGTNLGELDDTGLALYRRQTVGFVFQDSSLILALTVFENVMLPLVPMALLEPEKINRVEQALDEVNIAHRASHLPGELSGGEQQRAAVARAIVNDPRLVLADEPTGELDADNASRVMELLLGLNNEGRTVIVASHDAATIDMTERVVRLQEGSLIRDQM